MFRNAKGCTALGLALLMAAGLAFAHNDYERNPDFVQPGGPLPGDDVLRLNYLFDSFEDAWPPAGWTIMTSGASTTWEQTSNAANSGMFSAAVFYGPQGAMQDEWLVTPALDVSGAGMLYLDFFEMEAYWSGYGLRHHIAVSTTVPDDPGAFTMVETWTPADHDIPADFGGDPVTVNLSAYIGESTLYVAFRYEGDWADDWYIDDVRLYEPSDHDIAALAALPVGHVDGGTTITPQAVVKNVGQNTESFDVEYEILEGGVVVYSEIEYVSGLAPDAETTVDFPGFLTSEGLYYETHVTTMLGTDEDPSNDEAWGGFDTYLLGHVPMMFLFTNSGCGPCVQANQAMDAYMPLQGNSVALMRLHTWWPNPGDIMYTYNPEPIDALVDEYGVWGVPWFWLDGIHDLAHTGSDAVDALEEAKYWASPMSVTPVLWCIDSEVLTVQVDIQGALPEDSDLRLHCCYTEDNIYHVGGNGEDTHHQAFRYMYPDLEGLSIPSAPGVYTYEVPMPLDPFGNGDWVFENLRATCYVQDRGGSDYRHILEAGTCFVTEIMDVTPVALSFFQLEPSAGMVELAWETARDGDFEFRLTRRHEGELAEIPYESPEPGVFTAVDRVPAGGSLGYELSGREAGEDWQLLRSENVVIEPALLSTRILGGFPNPFNPKTTIRFAVDQAGPVKLSVFDLQGRLVTVLFQGEKAAGEHELVWDAGDLGSGVYLINLQGVGQGDSKKIVLTK